MPDYLPLTAAIAFAASVVWLAFLVRTRRAALSLSLVAKNYQENVATPWGAVDYPGSTKGNFISLVLQRRKALGITGPMDLDAPVPEEMRQYVRYAGVAQLPRKVYVDDSIAMSVTLAEETFYQKQHPDESVPGPRSVAKRFNVALVRGVGIETW